MKIKTNTKGRSGAFKASLSLIILLVLGLAAGGGIRRLAPASQAKTTAVTIPQAYSRYVEHQASLTVNGSEYLIAKLNYDGTRFEEVAFDADGRIYPADAIRQAYVDQFRRYGKIHPSLARAIESNPGRMQPTMIWLNVTPLPMVERPENLTAPFERVMAEMEAEHRRNLEPFSQEKALVLGRLALGREEFELDLDGSPFVIANLTADRIRQLSESDSVQMLLAYDASMRDDLSNSLAIAGANTVINSGITGNGVKVAVWETGCPDLLSFSTITSMYLGPKYCTPSTHARMVTGIIQNIFPVSGFAPGASIYSADSADIAALAWAIDKAQVSVVNQSFHRETEPGDGLQADDLYKDYKAVHFPFPMIVHAAGNWCAMGTACYENGFPNLLTEFVNHKGYNTISIGNHNDAATSMAPSSVFVNPTTPHRDRELPELSANGMDVTAVGLVGTGTSFSAPAVTGSVALLQEAQPTLRFWPEGVRALLFAGATTNIPTHAGQFAGLPNAPNTWWQDVLKGNDGFDGAGALNVNAARRISNNSWKGSPLARGWDVGKLTDSSFDATGFVTETYQVTIPSDSNQKHVKVALAWDSLTIAAPANPATIYSSLLLMDLDLLIFEDGKLVAKSQSFDNSYEIAEFDGAPGKTYTIKIKRWSGASTAWTYFGIAWDLQ